MADPKITDAVLEKISAHLGASSETLQKVKFGRGTVGKLAIIGVFSVAAISLATMRLNGSLALFGIGAMVLVTLSVLGLILYVVVSRPELAVLEGTELVMYKQVTLDKVYTPGSRISWSGIYRCKGCGREVVHTFDKPMPPQNHHQHTISQGSILWQLIVTDSPDPS